MKYAGRDLLDAGWQGEPTGLSYLFGFIRRQFLVLFLTPLVFLAAGLTFLITAQPQYTATSSLFVRLGPLAQTTTPSPLDNHAELVRSNQNTALVVEDLELDEIFSPSPGRLKEIIDRTRVWLGYEDSAPSSEADSESLLLAQVQSGLTVERVGNSSVIAISYTAPERALSVNIANAFAELYVRSVTEDAERSLAQRKAILETRAELMRSQALTAQDAARGLISKSNFIATSAEGLQNRIEQFHQQLSDGNVNEAEVRARLALVSQDNGMDVLAAPALQTDETLAMYSEMLSASRKLEALQEQSGVSTDTLAPARRQHRRDARRIGTHNPADPR